MRLRSYLILLFGMLGLALGMFPAATAGAQSVTIVETNIEHSIEITGRKATEIWYRECVDANATITISFTLTSPGDRDLEVWTSVQDNCTDDSRRTDEDSDCESLGDVTGDREVTLRVRDLLAPAIPDGASADNPCASIEKTSINVYFLLMDGTTTDASDSLSFSVDFEGPDAPELNEVGVGEEQLYADWDGSDSTDIDGYYVFCEPIDGGASSGTGGSSATTGGNGGDGTGNGGTAGDAATGGTTSGGSTSSGSGTCSPSLLVAGQRPAEGLIRSKKHSKTATKGPSGRLENDQEYACAVAGVDSQGNVGNLSEVQCGMPRDLTDFYEAYTRAGGQGGGGFCAFGPPRKSSAFALAGLGIALLIARRKYRSTRS